MRIEYANQIDKLCSQYAEKNVLVSISDMSCQAVTHRMLHQVCQQIGEFMTLNDIRRSERIAVMMPLSAQTLALLFGLAYNGYVAILIDETLPAETRCSLLHQAQPTAIFTISELVDSMGTNILCHTPLFCFSPDYQCSILQMATEEVRHSFSDDDVIAILFSSGTTGEMKGVEIRYDTIFNTPSYLEKCCKLRSGLKYLDVLPHTHIAGYAMAFCYFLWGAEIGVPIEINAASISSAMILYQPNHFIMIPKIYELMKSKIIAGIDSQSFATRVYLKAVLNISHFARKFFGIKLARLTSPIRAKVLGRNMTEMGVGAAPCSTDIMSFFLDLGIDFTNVYGSTETCFPITSTYCGAKYADYGVGNIHQFSDIQVKLLGMDEHGVGEICVKTPLIMKGYLNDAEATKKAFTPDGYYKTGDLGIIDSKNNLTVVGRKKDSFVLPNGKNVSALDVDHFYTDLNPTLSIACNNSMRSDGSDNIDLYIDASSISETQQNTIRDRIHKQSASAPDCFKINEIFFVSEIPKTSLGKIKRHMLTSLIINQVNESLNTKSLTFENNESTEETVLSILKSISSNQDLTYDMRLKEDVGIDSLGFYVLSTEIESKIGVQISDSVDTCMTVSDLMKIVSNGKQPQDKDTHDNLECYPKSKTKHDLKMIRFCRKASSALYNFHVVGAEHLLLNRSIILAPNHESYFDAMWVAAALDSEGIDLTDYCCLAAKELMNKPVLKHGFSALGGIPIERKGNTVSAMQRASTILKSRHCMLMIHPEGTRTRNGQLGNFKNGTARLSLETQTPIIPVYIKGAYEIYSPNQKLPHLFDFKKKKKYDLFVTFGSPIFPESSTTEIELTSKIRNSIERMMEGIDENRN